MTVGVLIYGYGGHGRVLAELLNISLKCNIGVFDDQKPEDLPVYIEYLGQYNKNTHPDKKIILAIGDNNLRAEISAQISHAFFTFIHPNAYVSSKTQIGIGTIVLQNAIIQNKTSIGVHCIVNIGSLIDHDVVIEDFCHLAPATYVGGGSKISSFSCLDPGQIIPRLTIL
jgi:acetyltransferase EpsM